MTNNKKKVVLVVFNSFENDSRVLKEAISLQSNGFSVSVVALHSVSLPERESFHNILIHRINLSTKKWPKNKFLQFIKYIEFLFRFLKEYRTISIVHCNDLIALPVGVFIKIFFNKKIKIIYDAHEYEINDIPNQLEKNIKIKFYIEKFLIKYADKVITVSNSIASDYKRLYGIPKPKLVLNCPPYADIPKQDLFRDELGIRKDQNIFLYQGGLTQGRGIDMLCDAFSKDEGDKDVIVFMGYGPLESYIQQKSKENNAIFFRDAVLPQNLLEYTASADYGVSYIEDSCLSYRYCLPNKLFEYIMAGIPILVSNLFEMKKFVEKHKVGVVAEENTVIGFLEAVKKIKEMDHAELLINIEKARKIFTWEKQQKTLLEEYCDL